MAFNIGGQIGSVEGDGATGQAYATKVVRTYQLSTTLGANTISTNGGILASDGTDVGYKTIAITTPFMNGTYPRHLTITNVRVSTNSVGLQTAGVGVIIFPSQPSGVFNRTTTSTGANTQNMSIAFSYISSNAFNSAFSSDTYKTGLYTLNQMIGSTPAANITNLYVVLYLGTTAFTPVAGTIVNIQVDVSFE
jgi:hypothetical protein